MIAVYGYSPAGSPKEGRKSKVRKKAVNAYVTSLLRTWVKPFGLENVALCITVAKKIRAELESILIVFCVKNALLCPKENDYGSGGNLQK